MLTVLFAGGMSTVGELSCLLAPRDLTCMAGEKATMLQLML